jgi:hypothetical protein
MARKAAQVVELPSHGKLIDELFEIREQLRALSKQERELKAVRDDLVNRLLASLDAAGINKAGSKLATASISETEVGTVEDWDRFHAWLRKTNRLYMLERRVAQAAYREYVEQARGHKPPPGVKTFKKRSISLYTAS